MIKEIMITVLVITFAGSVVVAYSLCRAASRGDRFIKVDRRGEAE